MITVADYVVSTLREASQGPAFLLSGGYTVHLNDAVGRLFPEDYVCCLHEQAVVMAAEGYARASGRIGVAYVTAGPGASNALTGVLGAWLDSSPVVIVAGQLKREFSSVRGPRQFGFQGFDPLPSVRSMTKYAVSLTDKAQVKAEVRRCIDIAMSPRRGPVWLEIPVDFQGESFNPDDYPDPPSCRESIPAVSPNTVEEVARLLRESRRPCLLAGAGIRAAGAVDVLDSFIKRHNLPVLTSRNGTDLVDADNPLFVGRPGVQGTRGANFTVELCDLFISVGCRLEVLVTGYDYKRFAPNAKKVVVDCDSEELSKPSIGADHAILGDAGAFLSALDTALGDYRFSNETWLGRIGDWKRRYPTLSTSDLTPTEKVSTYHFLDVIARVADNRASFVIDTSHAIYAFPQVFRTKRGQRHMLTGGLATMGYFPAAIGVAKATGRPVIAIVGDGCLQMNVQELQTIVSHRLPVKLFVLSNGGYLLIRRTQELLKDGRLVGSDNASGLTFPDLEKLSAAYGIPFIRIADGAGVEDGVRQAWEMVGPVLVEVVGRPEQEITPRLKPILQADGSVANAVFDRMSPLLPEDEYLENRRLVD